MNNTYNRMLILVVNERLEEGKKLNAIKKAILPIATAGALVVGGTQMAKTGGSTSPPIRPTQSIQHSDNAQARSNTTLAQPKARTSVKPQARTSVKPEDTESESELYPKWKRPSTRGTSHYGLPGLPKDALGRAKETPKKRQERLHREGKVPNSYLPDNN